MATVYGSTLDSLMAGRLGQQRADADERNAYRAFLNQVANTGIRSREQQAMDRYRMGDLDVRREDVGGINEFRRGQISNDALRAGAYSRDVDSLVGERPLTRAMQEKIAGMNLEAAKLPFTTPRPISEAERRQLEINEKMIDAQMLGLMRPMPEIAALQLENSNTRDAEERSAFAALFDKIAGDYEKDWTWGPFSANTPEVARVDQLQKSGTPLAQAIQQAAAERFRMMYPSSRLFGPQQLGLQYDTAPASGTNRPPAFATPGINTNAPSPWDVYQQRRNR